MIESEKSAEERYRTERLISRVRRDFEEHLDAEITRLERRGQFFRLVVSGLSILVGALIAAFAFMYVGQRELDADLSATVARVADLEAADLQLQSRVDALSQGLEIITANQFNLQDKTIPTILGQLDSSQSELAVLRSNLKSITEGAGDIASLLEQLTSSQSQLEELNSRIRSIAESTDDIPAQLGLLTRDAQRNAEKAEEMDAVLLELRNEIDALTVALRAVESQTALPDSSQ
ncbi:MAG: hypothetical protein QNJ16_11420 [Rhodobacter sp.]|nr:hypothetical protein [Rhodobacter sp.]